jgi:hypothetical protein
MPARPEMGDRVRDSIEFDGVPEKKIWLARLNAIMSICILLISGASLCRNWTS